MDVRAVGYVRQKYVHESVRQRVLKCVQKCSPLSSAVRRSALLHALQVAAEDAQAKRRETEKFLAEHADARQKAEAERDLLAHARRSDQAASRRWICTSQDNNTHN